MWCVKSRGGLVFGVAGVEVAALCVGDYKAGEVFYFREAHGFHAEFGVIDYAL